MNWLYTLVEYQLVKTREDEISAFAAKTHLSELLGEVERGRSFVICRRGKAVSRLAPPEQHKAAK